MFLVGGDKDAGQSVVGAILAQNQQSTHSRMEHECVQKSSLPA